MSKLAEIMQPPVITLSPEDQVGRAIEVIRATSPDRQFTYPMVVDEKGRLQGVCTLRDLILAPAETPVKKVMLRKVVALPRGQEVHAALERIKGLEIPEYPVVSK